MRVHARLCVYHRPSIYCVTCATYMFVLIYTADPKPNMKLLQRHVIPHVASKWLQLGIELFDAGEEHKLYTIESNHKDVDKCCFEMFRLWLNTHVNPTWTQIVEALESPGVHLLSVASDLKKLIGKVNNYIIACELNS